MGININITYELNSTNKLWLHRNIDMLTYQRLVDGLLQSNKNDINIC